MDSFAARRERLRASGCRTGRTLSLNWSLWADGGMKLDEQTELFFKKSLGILPLRTEVGLEAFVDALRLARPQIAVLEGVQAKIEQAWGMAKKDAVAPSPVEVREPSVRAGDGDLAGLVIKELSAQVMALLKLDAEDLSLDSILLDLGFDSIGLTTFANAINDRYQLDINPVLFFEHPSIRAIGLALVTEHRGAVEKVHGASRPAAAVETPSPSAARAARRTAAVTRSSRSARAGSRPSLASHLARGLGISRELRFSTSRSPSSALPGSCRSPRTSRSTGTTCATRATWSPKSRATVGSGRIATATRSRRRTRRTPSGADS
jgi:polyketide synthase PksN